MIKSTVGCKGDKKVGFWNESIKDVLVVLIIYIAVNKLE